MAEAGGHLDYGASSLRAAARFVLSESLQHGPPTVALREGPGLRRRRAAPVRPGVHRG